MTMNRMQLQAGLSMVAFLQRHGRGSRHAGYQGRVVIRDASIVISSDNPY